MRRILTLVAASVFLSASAYTQETRSDRYERREAGRQASVLVGTIIDVRTVSMGKGATDSYVGAGIGAATGAAIGNAATRHSSQGSQNIATIAGGVLGGIAGASIERRSNNVIGDELIIELGDGRLVSITQSHDASLRVGSKVYVIYSDRTRVVPAPAQK